MSITNSTIGQNLLHQMPQPIASAWSLLLRAEDASEKIRLCWGVIDIFLRYTTAITLSHYLRGESSPNVERLLPYLRRPSFGHYCAIIREILRNSDAGEAHFLNHIHSWYFTEDGSPSSAAKELDYFIAMRNRDTHHGSRTSDELDGVIESLVDEIQLFLHKAKWLSGYSLYSFSSPNMRRKGGFSGQSFRYHGQNINPLPKSKQWSCRLFPETVYICNPEGTQFLEVSPLLILESNRHNTFYLFSSTPKGLRLDSRCTVTETSKQFVPKIHNLDVSWDEFVSKRQDLDPIAHNSEDTFFRIDSFFEIGMVINNRYKIKSRIGSGGMAVVFHAEDQFLEREVALKILHIEQVDSVNRNRAIKEFLRMTELNHPNIVSVYESVNLADNRVAVSMPLYQGSIKDLFHVQKPEIEQVETWAEQILSALDYLHNQEQTIIHRDIKPSNIFIDKEGNALLGDFGIARKEGDARLTKTSEQIGSQAYMSPEQKQGIAEPHNDRYSLGITLHEIITGDLPKIPGEGIDGDLGILITMLTSDNIEDRMNASWPLSSQEEVPPEKTSEEEIVEETPKKEVEESILEEEVETHDEGLLQEQQPESTQSKHLEQTNEQRVAEQEVPAENVPKEAEYVESKAAKEEKEPIPAPENLWEPEQIEEVKPKEEYSSKNIYIGIGLGALAVAGAIFVMLSTSYPQTMKQLNKEEPVVDQTVASKEVEQKNYEEVWKTLNKDIYIGAKPLDPELESFVKEVRESKLKEAGKALQEWRAIAIQKIQDDKLDQAQQFISTYKKSTNPYIKELVSIAQNNQKATQDTIDELFKEFDSQKESMSKKDLEHLLKKIANTANVEVENLSRYQQAALLVEETALHVPSDIVLGSYLNILIEDTLKTINANGTSQTISKSGLFGCDKGTNMRGVTVNGKLYDASSIFTNKRMNASSLFFEGSESTLELLELSKRPKKESCINNKKTARKGLSIFQIMKTTPIATKELQKGKSLILTNTIAQEVSSKYFALKVTNNNKKQIYVFGN